MMYWVGRFLCWLASLFFFPTKAEGRDHIPLHGGFILAGNHQSYLDPPVFGIACPRALHFMARDTLFKNPIFGLMFRLVNVFPVKRDSADIRAIKEALRRLKKGGGIFLFPEGTRGRQGESIGAGRLGAAFLARKTGVPIIPAVVLGTEHAMPRGAKTIRRTNIRVIFGAPVAPRPDLSDEALMAEVMGRLSRLKKYSDKIV